MTREQLLSLWQPSLAALERAFAVLPDEPDNIDTPLWSGTFETPQGEKQEQALTLRQLLAHLVVSAYEVPLGLSGFGQMSQVGQLQPVLRQKSVPELRAELADRVARMIEFLNGLDEAELNVTRELHGGTRNVGEALGRAALHLVHHKGQLSIYVRLAGGRPGMFLG